MYYICMYVLRSNSSLTIWKFITEFLCVQMFFVYSLNRRLFLSPQLQQAMAWVWPVIHSFLRSEKTSCSCFSASFRDTCRKRILSLTLSRSPSLLQTYGSKNMKRVGVVLQRSSIILLLFCLPCWALLINSYSLLRLLHQEDEVAR